MLLRSHSLPRNPRRLVQLIALIASLQKDSAGGKEAAAELEKTDPKFKAQNDLRAAQATQERVNSDPNATPAEKAEANKAVADADSEQAAAADPAADPTTPKSKGEVLASASVTASVVSVVAAAVLLAALC